MSITSRCTECGAESSGSAGIVHTTTCIATYLRPPAIELKFETPEQQKKFMDGLGQNGGIDLGLGNLEAKPKATVTPPLGLVDEIQQIVHLCACQCMNTDDLERVERLEEATGDELLQAVIEWADKELIGEDAKLTPDENGEYNLMRLVENQLRTKQRAMLNELKGE